MKKLFVLLFFCSITAQAQLSSYRYKQALENLNQSGWHSLTLPITIFDRMESYNDLRIYGISVTDTIEVPYMIADTVVATQTITHFAVKNDKASKHTIIDVKLPEILLLGKVAIHPTATYDYYRSVKILQNETTDDTYLSSVAKGVLNSKGNNIYTFAPQLFKHLQIDIDNQDNTPLAIDEITLFPITYKLTARFPDMAHHYFLVYGKANDIAPQYDITHFVKHIPKQLPSIHYNETVEYVKTQPITATTSVTKSPTNGTFVSAKPLLWAIMGIVVLLIFVFSVKMMRNK
jgi:hypothetical protein